MRRRTGSTTAPSRTSVAAIANCIRDSRVRSPWSLARISKTRGEWCATTLSDLVLVSLPSREGVRGQVSSGWGQRTVFELQAYLKERAVLIERALAQAVSMREGLEARLFEAMRYSLLEGGKRLRPILAL